MKVLRFNSTDSTEELASEVFTILGIKDFQKGESANYPPDEEYFMGKSSDGISIQVYKTDEINSDTNYAISLQGEDNSIARMVDILHKTHLVFIKD